MEILSDEQQQVDNLLEHSGGHVIPQVSDPVEALEHYHRYVYASRFVGGKRVLDIGCGDGYGTAFMSLAAREVLGVDCSEQTVSRAREKYVEFSNAHFEHGRGEELASPETPFDVIVCYHMLEHLDSESQVRFMTNIKKSLATKGIMILSTPDRSAHTTSPDHGDGTHTLSAVELYEFLKSYFTNVIFVGQKPLTLSAMWSLHGWQDDAFTLHAREELFATQGRNEQFTDPVNILAVCSDEHLPRMIADSSNSLYFDSKHDIHLKEVLLQKQQLQGEVEQMQDELVRMRREYNQSTDVVQKLYAENVSMKNTIAEMQIDVEERTSALHRLENSIAERNDVTEKLQTEHNTLVANVSTLTEDNAGLHAWVRELQIQLEDQALKAQKSSEEYEKAAAALTTTQQQAQESATQLTALREEHSLLQNQHNDLQLQAQSSAEIASQEIDRQLRNANMLTIEVDQLRRTSEHLKQQHDTLQIQHRELLQRFDEQLISVSKGRDEVDALRTYAANIQTQLEEQTTYAQLYSEENEALKQQLSALQAHDEQEANLAKNMFRENETLKARITELQKNADDVNELTNERVHLVEQVHTLQQEKEQHAERLRTVEESFKQRLTQADNVLRQYEEGKVALRQLRSEIEKQTIAFDTFQKSQGDLQQRYNKSQIKVQEMQAYITLLEQKLEKISHTPVYKMFSSMGLVPKKDV